MLLQPGPQIPPVHFKESWDSAELWSRQFHAAQHSFWQFYFIPCSIFFSLKKWSVLFNKIWDILYLLKESLTNPPQIPRLSKLKSFKVLRERTLFFFVFCEEKLEALSNTNDKIASMMNSNNRCSDAFKFRSTLERTAWAQQGGDGQEREACFLGVNSARCSESYTLMEVSMVAENIIVPLSDLRRPRKAWEAVASSDMYCWSHMKQGLPFWVSACKAHLPIPAYSAPGELSSWRLGKCLLHLRAFAYSCPHCLMTPRCTRGCGSNPSEVIFLTLKLD